MNVNEIVETLRPPWFVRKHYHCDDCAANDENFKFVISDRSGRIITDDISDEKLIRALLETVNCCASLTTPQQNRGGASDARTDQR